MKFLLKSDEGFLEAKVGEDAQFESTDIKVNPRLLVHFGTEILKFDSPHYAQEGFKELEKSSKMDYLLVSKVPLKEHMLSHQYHMVTSFMKK